MTNKGEVMVSFKRNGISVVAYLPDTALSKLINGLEVDNAFTVLSGVWPGHERGSLVCQSSGSRPRSTR